VQQGKENNRHLSVENAAGKDLYFVLHIPKCAGRTIEDFIVSNFGDRGVWTSGETKKWSSKNDEYEGLYGGRVFFPTKRKSPYRYFGRRYNWTDTIDPDSKDFVIGFYIAKSLQEKFPNRNIRETVLIRDPVGHFYSHYNFRMQKYTNAGMKAFDFDLFYKSWPPDPISKFIFSYLEVPFFKQFVLSDQAKLDYLLDALAGFWHVGLHKDCDKLIARIADAKGIFPEFETQNVTNKKFLDSDEYRKKYSKKIIDENRIDQAIFEFFSSEIPIEKRPRPKIQGRKFKNLVKEFFVPLHTIIYRIKRR
jgi:hypothetical protein